MCDNSDLALQGFGLFNLYTFLREIWGDLCSSFLLEELRNCSIWFAIVLTRSYKRGIDLFKNSIIRPPLCHEYIFSRKYKNGGPHLLVFP